MVQVIILAYNEEAGIAELLRELDSALREEAEPYRLVVVDDGSTDRTAERVRALAGALPVELLSHVRNLGVARAFETGLRHAAAAAGESDAIVTMEGDRTNGPGMLPAMLRELRRGYDVVCASRYREGGRYVGFPWLRRLMSLGANWSMRLLFPVEGVRDYTIFYRAYRARAIQAAIRSFGERFIECRGFTANAEILYKAAMASEIRCSETPMVYRYDLKKGRSKMRLWRNLLEYWALFRRLFAGRRA